MGIFDFAIQTRGQICLASGKGTYIIQRKAVDGYVPLSIDGIKLRVSPANTCVLIEFAGEYRIEWPEADCCTPYNLPAFEYTEHAEPFSTGLVCLKKIDSDEPVFMAWASGCAVCNGNYIVVDLFTIDGKTKLDQSQYQITNCC